MNTDYKMKNVLILKCETDMLPERRVYIKARVKEYRGHKFLIQGNSKTGYSIGDFETGMLINGTVYTKLKYLEDDFTNTAERFIKYIDKNKEFYIGAIDRFNKAPIIEEE